MHDLLTRIAAAVCLVLAIARPAAAEDYPLWIGYNLLANPDLEILAREVEAKARTERQGAFTFCERSTNQRDCQRQAEITFRGRLLSEPSITFGLYSRDPSTEGSGAGRWRINLPRRLATSPDFDRNFHALQPGRISQLGLAVTRNGATCSLTSDRGDAGSFGVLRLVLCELIDYGEDAHEMLWRWADTTGSSAAMTAFLLENGADPNRRGAHATPVLLRALQRGHLELARSVIDHNADVNAAAADAFDATEGMTPLMWAAAAGQSDAVRLLLDHHADPNVERRQPRLLRDPAGDSAKRAEDPLSRLASRRRDPSLHAVPDSLEPLRHVPCCAMNWSTALAMAFANHHLDAARLLIDAGALVDQVAVNIVNDTSQRGVKQGWKGPPLVMFFDDVDAVGLLLEHDADVNGRDGDGDTALLLACGESEYARRDAEVVRILLAHHADPALTGRRGVTALETARRHQRDDLVPLLSPHAVK